jgi:primosomal protein N' (replication factor Y)
VVRVLPDVPAIDRTFDYRLPEGIGTVRVGTVVRVPLSGRSVRGWVLDDDVRDVHRGRLSEVSRVQGVGPDAEVVGLCRWAAWRWAGRLATMLRLATAPRLVRSVPAPRVRPARAGAGTPWGSEEPDGVIVLEQSPLEDPVELSLAMAARGQAIVVAPSVATVDRLTRELRRGGAAVARWPEDWAAAASGATVVGGRSAVFAPAPALAGVLVVDEHDEALQSESSPTWHAREVAVERAARRGVPVVLASPVPTLEARLAAGSIGSPAPDGSRPMAPVLRPTRSRQREGWAPLTVVDRRGEDVGRSGLYSTALVAALRDCLERGETAVCVLNRTGRARLLACRSCGSMAECAVCAAAVRQGDGTGLRCDRCGAGRPMVCLACGSGALANLRVGVSRAREELEALVRVPVAAVTGAATDASVVGSERVVVGTEAALHRVPAAGLVAFLDLDQELLAPRYRAAEEALALLVRASRAVGGRRRGGRVLVQTRLPEHEVLLAALRADPGIVAAAELERRTLLSLPPMATIAVVAGPAAEEFVGRLDGPAGIEVLDAGEGRWILRAAERATLLDRLAEVRRPGGRLSLQVDPLRIR